MHCLATKEVKIALNFKIHENCVAMETESFIPNKEFNIFVDCLCMLYCISIIRQLFYVF